MPGWRWCAWPSATPSTPAGWIRCRTPAADEAQASLRPGIQEDKLSTEKRLLLALALSTAVIFGYNWYIDRYVAPRLRPPESIAEPAPEEPRAPKSRPRSRTGRATPSALEKERTAVSPAPAVKPIARGREITVETSSVLARFSTAGGRVVSWHLKGFRATGTTVYEEMIPRRAASLPEGPLSVRLSDDSASASARAESPSSRLSVAEGGKGELVFTERLKGGRTLVKRLSIPGKGHLVDLVLELTGPAPRYLDVLWTPGVGLTPDEEAALGHPGTYQNIPRIFVLTPKDILKQGVEKKPKSQEGDDPFWTAFRDRYFVAAFLPDPVAKCDGVESVSGLAAADGTPHGLESGLRFSLKDGASRVRIPLRAYIGPQDYVEMKKIGSRFERATDFGMFGVFAVWLLYALKFLAFFTHNYGFAIVLLTIFVRILLWYPSQSSMKQMQKMKEVQPQLQFINEKFKDDPARKNEETMRLFKEQKINPLGGCLPFAFQLPIFFALFAVLGNAIELRGAPFVLWITDLSAKDHLYVFPVLVGVTMWVQQMLTPTTGDPAQAKMMKWMSLVFVLMFVNAPAGLNLYWLVQNVIQIGQQLYTQKKMAPGIPRRT